MVCRKKETVEERTNESNVNQILNAFIEKLQSLKCVFLMVILQNSTRHLQMEV